MTKRRLKSRPTDPVEKLRTAKQSVGGLLTLPQVSLEPDEQQIADMVAKQIVSLLNERTVKINGACTVTQAKTATTPHEYRRISMVGGELMTVQNSYFGKRDGLILQLRCISIPLGMKSDDLENTLIEIPLRLLGSFLSDVESGKNVREYLEDFMNFNDNPMHAIEVAREKAKEIERDLLVREATIKQESYGMNWGAY